MKLLADIRGRAHARTPLVHSKRHWRSKCLGLTTLEVLVSSTISFLAITGAIAMLVAGSTTWYKGEGKMLAETQSQRAVRLVSAELREAMAVTVDANGLGVTYRLPSVSTYTGSYLSPAVWDNVTRRIEYIDGIIRVTANGSSRTICKNVILTDPQSTNGSGAYVLFAPGAGFITRRLTVMVATQTSTYRGGTTKSRSRETVYLRNIPELSRG